MRCMIRVNGKWKKEDPQDLSKWIWANDGEDAVVVDDETTTYYCGNTGMMETYQAAWMKENKPDDPRKAAMFIDLDKILFSQE